MKFSGDSLPVYVQDVILIQQLKEGIESFVWILYRQRN